MIFTLEALYALHMFNDHSDDLFFLPLPETEDNRLDTLKHVLEKGYDDLTALNLISDNQPTEDCAKYGLLLETYQKAARHAQINQIYFCALEVGENSWDSIIISQLDDNQYSIERMHSLLFLGILIENLNVLKDLDKHPHDIDAGEWQIYAPSRLMMYYGRNDAIHIATFRRFHLQKDMLFFASPSGLYQYDRLKEKIRAVSGSELKSQLIHQLKVRIS